jgi:hypothetical protein
VRMLRLLGNIAKIHRLGTFTATLRTIRRSTWIRMVTMMSQRQDVRIIGDVFRN